MKKLIVLSILILSFTFIAFSETKDSSFEYFKKKFANLETIKVNFQSLDNKTDRGELTASNKNEFRIITNDRIIICDGQSIFNHSVSQKQVIISEAEETISNPIYTTFFNIIENSKPVNLKKTTNSKNKVNYILTIVSNNGKNELIDIYYDNSKTIFQIGFKMKNISGNYKISKLQVNKKINQSTFKYKENSELEVIDLR